MTPTQMLAELAKSYTIEISRIADRFRLQLRLREVDLASDGDLVGHWVGVDLDGVVARAWAGERPDA